MLTSRQFEVMSLKSLGKSNREIASKLGVNESTVQEHVQSVVKKLGASNASHCLTLFERQRLADRLRNSGFEETLRAYIKEQTGKEALSDVTLDDGLSEIIDYIDEVLAKVESDD